MQADKDYGERVAAAVGESVADVKRMIDANRSTEPTRWKTIALQEQRDGERIVVRNSGETPLRYRVRTSASQWAEAAPTWRVVRQT